MWKRVLMMRWVSKEKPKWIKTWSEKFRTANKKLEERLTCRLCQVNERISGRGSGSLAKEIIKSKPTNRICRNSRTPEENSLIWGMRCQEEYKTPNIQDKKWRSPQHLVKTLNATTVLEATRQKDLVIYKGQARQRNSQFFRGDYVLNN